MACCKPFLKTIEGTDPEKREFRRYPVSSNPAEPDEGAPSQRGGVKPDPFPSPQNDFRNLVQAPADSLHSEGRRKTRNRRPERRELRMLSLGRFGKGLNPEFVFRLFFHAGLLSFFSTFIIWRNAFPGANT